MERFYQTLDEYLVNGNQLCSICGEDEWIRYTDGHIAWVCLKCPPLTFEANSDKALMLASYVLDQPVPTGPIPNHIEMIEDPDLPSYYLLHERNYHRKR